MLNFHKFFTKRNILAILIFAGLGLLALQVPFTQLVGSKVKFTLFDFFGPIAGGLIGTIPGIVAVFLMQGLNFFLHGAQVVDAGTIIRFFPILFAAWYFGRKSIFNLIIPAVAILAFWTHPIGREAWFFALYWLIPIACYFARERWLLARALGATFTAHAVGGALWIHTFGTSKDIWLSLIPVVAMERGLFALGIAATYLVLNNALNFLQERKILKLEKLEFLIDKRYTWNGARSR